MSLRGGVLLALSVAGPAVAANGAPVWTTLGTAGGPVVFAERSQPANLLTVGSSRFVVDCGDGCAERLAAAAVSPRQVDTILISHLHQDHIAGLAGLLGLRWMQDAHAPVTVYGPPGIEAVASAIARSLEPSERVGLPSGAKTQLGAAQMIKVVTLRDGADLLVSGVRIRAIRNTHFDENGRPADNGTESLSFRFDIGRAAIGYTGDTGPDEQLVPFFKGATLIVSEAADLEAARAAIEAPGSPVPLLARAGLIRHIAEHHITPGQSGAIARGAGARCLVMTHLSISAPTSVAAAGLAAGARATFAGEVDVARDLDRFGPSPTGSCKLA